MRRRFPRWSQFWNWLWPVEVRIVATKRVIREQRAVYDDEGYLCGYEDELAVWSPIAKQTGYRNLRFFKRIKRKV